MKCFQGGYVVDIYFPKPPVQFVVPAIFAVAVAVTILHTRLSVIPKLCHLSKQQIEEILATQPETFKQEVEARFASHHPPTTKKEGGGEP